MTRLPDDVLHEVLSFLEPKERARFSEAAKFVDEAAARSEIQLIRHTFANNVEQLERLFDPHNHNYRGQMRTALQRCRECVRIADAEIAPDWGGPENLHPVRYALFKRAIAKLASDRGDRMFAELEGIVIEDVQRFGEDFQPSHDALLDEGDRAPVADAQLIAFFDALTAFEGMEYLDHDLRRQFNNEMPDGEAQDPSQRAQRIRHLLRTHRYALTCDPDAFPAGILSGSNRCTQKEVEHSLRAKTE
jgi:hypothetical protein